LLFQTNNFILLLYIHALDLFYLFISSQLIRGHLNGHLVEWSLPAVGEKFAALRYVPNAHGPAIQDDRTQQEQMSSDMHDMRLKVDRGARDKHDSICTITAMVLIPNDKVQ
jgi:hypothetical protein